MESTNSKELAGVSGAFAPAVVEGVEAASVFAAAPEAVVAVENSRILAAAGEAAAAAAATEHSHVHVADSEVPLFLALPFLAATKAFVARILAAEPEAAAETGQCCPAEVAQTQSAHAAADSCYQSYSAARVLVEEAAAGSLRILAVVEAAAAAAAAVATEILQILAAAYSAADCSGLLVNSVAGS